MKCTLPNKEGALRTFGFIDSHTGYPNVFYTNNMRCQYNIESKEGFLIGIYFYKFDVEKCGARCNCDYLAVYDYRGKLRKKLCGYRRIPPIYSQNGLKLLFVTNSEKTWFGFRLGWYLIDQKSKLNVVLNQVFV